jgi:hypothetical protein
MYGSTNGNDCEGILSLFQHTINGKTGLQAGVCVGFFGPE